MSTKKMLPGLTLGLAALVLVGCLDADSGANPAASDGGTKTLPTSAYIDKQGAWFSYACCGYSPAFSPYSSNTGWALDKSQTDQNGNFRATRWSNGVKTSISGYFRKLDIVGTNELWGLDGAGSVYRNADPYSSNGGTWRHFCACGAYDIGAGANGTVVILSNNGMKRFDRNSGRFVDIYQHHQDFHRVDVDNNGDIYALRHYDRRIYRLRPPYNTPWLEYNFYDDPWMGEIAVGNGKVFLLAAQGGNNDGRTVFQWTPGSSFLYRDISGVGMDRIHVTAGGKLWGSTYSGYMAWSNM